MLSGSLMVMGMLTLERSLPMFLYRKLNREKSSLLEAGMESFVRRPVKHLLSVCSASSAATNKSDQFSQIIGMAGNQTITVMYR